MSFQLSITPNRRAAARFVGRVRRSLQKALADRPDTTQSQIADSIGVHRSVITRQLRGGSDMSLGRVAEIAWALGYEPEFQLRSAAPAPLQNIAAQVVESEPKRQWQSLPVGKMAAPATDQQGFRTLRPKALAQ